MLSKIYNLLNYCYEDSILEKFAGLEFQLFILTTKSLLPFENKIGCGLDINRYKSEMEIFRYYKNGNDETISYYFNNSKPSEIEDFLLEYKILPIAISNTDWETLIDEVLKIVLLYSHNKNTILSAIILSSVIYEYFYSEVFDIDLIINKTKDRLIRFSFKDLYLNKINMQINKEAIIEFEKERVKLLSKSNLFCEIYILKFKSLQHIFNKCMSCKMVDKGNEVVLNNFAVYIQKLRNGTVSPEKLKYSQEELIDFKKYLSNSSFVHPLLGKCILLKRESSQIILKNKLGLLKVNI
ncbi:hypothetical protein J2Z76_003098 [Sedimentibacter acidaminivorans]|jgi:hypothetical protein|uniref:Uncharacterized protein n=1 Tax=Sedimentibacter acidaminivorans TaxID=913099 RepID=A0ABS4GHM7_9FIRM|nr:hypothetical protein [Sedimentibacter acidaminivorans]MBP1927201.1 hypothetical protein [Sedimentibacter acidaminivorans]